ncbi:MAG: hypothetical protein JF587_04255 [Catenulisporales bacterium]|nr:hypothetical protein [Catenulisporales bacterium]
MAWDGDGGSGSTGDGGADKTGGAAGPVRGGALSPRLVVLAGRKGKPSLLPFVAVLLVLGLLGMLALLLLNTELNEGAFTIKQQKATATKLTQEAERIQQSLASLDGPGALAAKASELGMVPNGNPAFLAPNGSVLGSPSAAPTSSPAAPTPAGAPAGAQVLPAAPTTTPTPGPTQPQPTPPAPPAGTGR